MPQKLLAARQSDERISSLQYYSPKPIVAGNLIFYREDLSLIFD